MITQIQFVGHTISPSPTPASPLPNAVQKLLPADVHPAVADGGGGDGFVVEFVFDQFVEPRLGADDGAEAFGVQEEDAAVDGDRRGFVFPFEAFFPAQVARRGVDAAGNAIVGDQVSGVPSL